MRRPQRLIALAVLIALSGALAGCGGGGMSSFDPSDLLDFLDTKKKLPGDRKPVFPDGVPGLEQGVPKNLYKGSKQEQIDQQNAEAAAPDPNAAPEEEGSTGAAPPAPKPKIVRRRTTAPPPDASAEQPAQQPAQQQPPQQSAAPFPAPMPSGTFTR
jgi:predicted small lipoprotein YifL